jgi:hypothetical protein
VHTMPASLTAASSPLAGPIREAKRLSERVIAGMRKAAAKGTKSGNPIGPGSMPRRKGQSSGFCGAAPTSTRRLRPSASGRPPFSGSGLKWALSKARPRRDAAVSSLTNGLSCDALHRRASIKVARTLTALGPGSASTEILVMLSSHQLEKFSLTVAWIERARNRGTAIPHGTAALEFRCAQPGLRPCDTIRLHEHARSPWREGRSPAPTRSSH